MIHRINVFLLSIFIIFSQTFIISTANAAVWSNIKGVATAAGGYFTSSATVGGAVKSAAATVPWSSLKKGLGKTLKIGGGAASIAIGLALDGADYVLDPANNTVTYKPKDGGIDCGTGSSCNALDKIWQVYIKNNSRYFSTYESACNAYKNEAFGTSYTYKLIVSSSTHVSCNVYSASGAVKDGADIYFVSNPFYSSTATKPQEETKTISLPDLIQKLIDRIGNNDAAIKNVLDQLLSVAITEAETNTKADEDIKALLNTIATALTKNAEYVESGTTTGTAAETKTENQTCSITSTSSNCKTTGTSSTDLSLEFPTFCGWAAITCEAAQTVIDFPTTISGYVDSLKEWAATENPPQTDTKVDIEEPDTTQMPTTSYFGWSAYCPFSKKSDSLSINNQTSNLDSDLTSWCEMATEVRPFVIAAGALASLMIVSGISMRGDD